MGRVPVREGAAKWDGEGVPRGDPGTRIDGRSLASAFFRSLAVQGSWNYRTMVGGGFAFALLPLLRRVFGSRTRELESALARHAEHFNSHPYLVGVALGAVARLEEAAESAEMIRRFKDAVKGPLGGLGDTLVWATWLPLTLLVALIAAWLGLGPLPCMLLFLTIYNAGHLFLRGWAFRVGLREGKKVGARLREAGLSHRTELLVRVGTVLLGTLVGILLAVDTGLGGARALWSLSAVGAFVLGLNGGLRVWRPTALLMVAVVVALFLTQAVT